MPLLNIYEIQIIQICYMTVHTQKNCAEIVLHIIKELDLNLDSESILFYYFMHLHELIFCCALFYLCVFVYKFYLSFTCVFIFSCCSRHSLFCFMLILTINLCYLFRKCVYVSVSDSHEKLIKTYMKNGEKCA